MTKKTITLIRHAKSSWGDPSYSDFERPLNKRGTKDAPRVGAAIAQVGTSFDHVLCSDAVRARQTLTLLNDFLAIDEGSIEYRHDMYCASAEHLLSSIIELTDSINNIALIGHNPGMEDLANYLAVEPPGAMPTCCVIHITCECDSWKELTQGSGHVAKIIHARDL